MGSFLYGRAKTLNAKIAALALAAAAFTTLLLTHVGAPLAPLRLLAMTLSAFAIWAFCDELGMRKPLNRAGFIFFSLALVARMQTLLGVPSEVLGRYYLLYAAFLLAAILLWSVAFLHREQTLKIVGSLGVATTLATLALLIVGHLAVGAGAVFGIGAIMAATNGSAPTDISFVSVVERMLGLWGYVTAWLLWRGYIAASPVATA